MRSLISLLVLTSVLSSSSVFAATRKVPQDFATIQSAVNAADPGDVIKVANGVFVENVLVPAGKNGLVIEGSGKTIIDARVLGNLGSGAAIACVSDGFVARRLTVRHAKGAPAIGIYVAGDDAVLDRVTSIHCEDYGLAIMGDRGRIEQCTTIASGIGISINGDDGIVRKSTARSVMNVGIVTIGTDNLVESCRVLRSDFNGILAAGLNANVKKCKVDGTRSTGIIANALGIATIVQNDVRRVADDGGIIVVTGAAGFVTGNRVSDVGAAGIFFTSNALHVSKNRVERSGQGAAGIFIGGSGSEVSDNFVRRCGGDGLVVAGGFHVLSGNRALQNDEDGVDVMFGPTTLQNNVATGNAGEGLENGPLGSVFIGNKSQKNRVDVVNAGAFATFEGNVFTSGGIGQLPEIDF